MVDFTPDSLVAAVRNLLTLNNYEVSGPRHVHGAEIDLIAKHKATPFSPTLYLEITVQYVNTEKYGKDFSKLGLFREIDPSGELIIVSATGFTNEVKERALHSRVRTLTYQELLGSFEQFEPYLNHILIDGAPAEELARLSEVYQVPFFNDTHGRQRTITWLDEWMLRKDASDAWLVIVGEYGTGKTALTQMMQKRWLEAYAHDPGSPIPLRIELGAFTRQFDADGLIHHFLDRNNLHHIPLAYVWSLIRSGRVVLLLDAYDEMAQYLSARERRTCLRTLAELTSDGARGLMTSRPNYFSEQEELNVFDILYRSLSVRSEFLVDRVESLQREEERIDDFISRSLLDKYERTIEDLTPEQTENLVRTKLSGSPEQADAVISVLRRVFRSDGEGSLHALSGKPVIISYLIEVADRIAMRSSASTVDADSLSEWSVYEMILEQLALRDLTHTERVSVRSRLDFWGV
ncbi:NACHT domain-containing protein [Sinomonas atrocyanea]